MATVGTKITLPAPGLLGERLWHPVRSKKAYPKREDFVRGLRQAKLLVPSDHPSVRLSLGDNSVGLSARSTDVGDAQIDIDAVVEGGTLDVAFNPEYVLEGLNAMTSDQVILHLNDPQKPARLDGEKDFVYVVMPVTMRAG